tara:strand:- start:3427 stop:9828 length:6402 start_codon:yes stop_codon:yes gene_type:complete
MSKLIWGGKNNTRVLKMLEFENEEIPIHPPSPNPTPPPPPPPNPPPDNFPTPSPPPPAPTPTPTPTPTPVPDPLPPDPSPALPAGLWPDDSDTWVRGTLIERSGTRLIRLDTSYSTTAQDFFGSEAETITTSTLTINQTDERFTTSESTKLIAHGNKITFWDSSNESAVSLFSLDLEELEVGQRAATEQARNELILTSTSKYGLEVGDVISWGAEEFEILSFNGNAAVVEGTFEAVVKSEFEIDTTIQESIIDPVVQAYTDSRAEFIEILGYPKPDSVYNIQDIDILVNIDGTHPGDELLVEERGKEIGEPVSLELLPGDRVDVKFTPPNEDVPPNWLGAYFVNIFDIREVDDTAGYFESLGLESFEFSNGQVIEPGVILNAAWLQNAMTVGTLTPSDIEAYNEWRNSGFEVASIPNVVVRPYVFQIGSYGPPDGSPDHVGIFSDTTTGDGMFYTAEQVRDMYWAVLEAENGRDWSLYYEGNQEPNRGNLMQLFNITIETVEDNLTRWEERVEEFNNTITAFEEEVVTWTEIYGWDTMPLYEDVDGDYVQAIDEDGNPIYRDAHELYDWFTGAVSAGQISQNQLNDYQTWLNSGRTISPFAVAEFPPPPFQQEIPEAKTIGCTDDRAWNWWPLAVTEDENDPCLYIPKYAVSVLWQWGDGTWNEQMLEPGYLEPMEHIFTQPGIYTTNIFVKYADGDVDGFEKKIAVKTEPRIEKNLWEWGDGEFDEVDGQSEIPNHVYKNPGLYQVVVTTLWNDGIDTYTQLATKEVHVLPNDAANLVLYAHGKEENISDKENPMTFVVGAKDDDGQIVKYEFDFGDGSAILEKDVELEDKKYYDNETFTETHRYKVAGHYVVKASVRDNSGNISTVSKVIYIDDVKYIPTYEPYVAQITDAEVIDDDSSVITVDRTWGEEAIAKGHVWGNPGSPAPNEEEEGTWKEGQEWEYPFRRASSLWRLKEKRDLRTLLNLGDNKFSLITNFRSDKLNWKNYPHAMVYKLYEPLPEGVEEKSFVHVSREMLPSIKQDIQLIDFVDDKVDGIVLRNASFNHDVVADKIEFEATDFKTRQQIVSSNSQVSKELENKFVSQSDSSIRLNPDYSNYENFIKFSSVQRRYDNFEYKIQRLEHYTSVSQSYMSVSASTDDMKSAERSIADIKNNFDDFEKYLYFESSSYTTSSMGEYFDTSWPKSGGSGTLLDPYVLAHTTSSQYLTWRTGNDSSASLYDRNNLDRLYNNLPLHIRDDNQNETFLKFIDMVGHHFDGVWLYTKALTDINHRTNKVNEGLSRDLVHEVAKASGWQVYDGKSLISLPEYALGVQVSGSDNVALQTTAQAERDITREVWNRILVNMPFFLKSKGTSRALKGLINCYGLPSTILRVREYGGPVLAEQNNQFEITRKFSRMLDFFGSQTVETTWVDDTKSGRHPDTIEFRFRAVNSGSNHQVLVHKDADWAIRLEPSGSGTDNYGYVSFAITGSSSNAAISSSALPVFDGEFYSVMLTRISASDAPMVDDNNGRNINYNLYVKKYDATRRRIYLQSSASLNVDGGLGGAPQGMNNRFQRDGAVHIGGKSTQEFGGQLTGSMMEFRYWNSPLSESRFDNHVRAPKSYDGNHPSASFENLVLRYPMHQTINHGTGSVDVIDTSADQSYIQSGSAKNYPDRMSYSHTEDVTEMLVPNIGGQNRRATKVRVEENKLIYGTKLSIDSRNEVSAFDLTSTDSNKLGVYFAPTDVINEDIIFSIGNLDISDFIGDPRDQYKTYYSGLKTLRDKYFQKYTSPNNFWDYLRILKFFDKAVFNQIKTLIPARANAHLGTLIEENLLRRNKIKLMDYPSSENPYFENSMSMGFGTASGTSDYHEGFTSESMYPATMGTSDYYQGFASESVQPAFGGTSDYYQGFTSESVNPGLGGEEDYYQGFTSQSLTPGFGGEYIDKEGQVSESMYPGFSGLYRLELLDSVNVGGSIISMSGSYEDFSNIALYGANSSTKINTYDSFNMPSLYSFGRSATRGDLEYSQSYVKAGGIVGGVGGKSIMEEVTVPFISSSRKNTYHLEEKYFYNKKNKFYRAGNMDIKHHRRYHANSSSLEASETSPIYESTTALQNLYFKGCKQTDDTTTDGKKAVEVKITSPTVLTTNETGDSTLSVE